MILATLSIFGQSEFNPKFNKKPLQDFAVNLNQKLKSKEVDLDKSFSVNLEGFLTKEGKFDLKRSKFTKSEGDAQMIAVGKSAIETINDSGIFAYLSDLGVEKVNLTLAQDDQNASFIINSELPNVEKAKTLASGFNLILTMAKEKVKEEEIKTIFNATKVSSVDKNCVIHFLMPKGEVHQLLKIQLQKQSEKSYSSKGELK